MYELALFIHIVCAVIWVGGAFALQVLAVLIARSTDPADLPKFGRHAEFIGMRVFLPASIVLFIAGAYMTSQRWRFEHLWISVAMALWLASALVGALYLGPRSKRVAELFESEGPTSVGARALLSRLFLVSRLELVSFLVILYLMAFKPGVG